jgi:drug/metabolite transporter (DMT)-like permease
MQLPLVSVAGWYWFDEVLDHWTVTGAAIIFAANLYIAHREAQLARLCATHAPTEAAKPGE